MAAVERKLSGLQGACLGLEEDSSAVAARVDSLQVSMPSTSQRSHCPFSDLRCAHSPQFKLVCWGGGAT